MDGISTCPICSLHIDVGGDPSQIEAHVDQCIIEASRVERIRAEAESGLLGYELDGQPRVRVTDLAGFNGEQKL